MEIIKILTRLRSFKSKLIIVTVQELLIIMESVQSILPQPVEMLRYPHVTKKIMEFAAPTFAEVTRLRRVSKDWMSYIDSEFLEKSENQDTIQKEQTNFAWKKGEISKIELPLPNWIKSAACTFIEITDDHSFCMYVHETYHQNSLAIFFKEKYIGRLSYGPNQEVYHVIQLDHAERLIILDSHELSEWKLIPNTDHYDKSRTIKVFSPDLPYFCWVGMSLMFGRPFVFWIDDQAKFNIFSIENAVSSYIQLPHNRFRVLEAHSKDKDRAFVNLEENFNNSYCVVVVDSEDENHENAIKYMPRTQSISSSSDYLISKTDNDVKIIDKSTLTPVATLTKLEAPELFTYGWNRCFMVSGNKIVYQGIHAIKWFDFKTGENGSLTLPRHAGEVVINDTLLIVFETQYCSSNWEYHCADLNHLEKTYNCYKIPDSKFHQSWITLLRSRGSVKLIGKYQASKTFNNGILVWKFGKEH